MTYNAEESRQKVVKFVQELLLEEADKSSVTPALIDDKIDLVLKMVPGWGEGLDRQAVTDDLIRRFSLWIGQDTTLKSDAGHVAWLTSERKRDRRYWQRYRELLERQLSFKAVDALDQSTDRILELMEDPRRDGPWDRRGLVVGHVQSGKTSNYTGLIGKAADAGYKIVIVLAGLHNNLRSQTQIRLDEGFLGYETKPVADDIRIVGVGEIDGDPSIRPNYATNRSDKGDFSTAVARNLGITPEQRPWLFVVKKNKTVLERLYRWIRNHVANAQDATGDRRIVTHLPLLVIDDEADHASVDTGEQVFDENGQPDDEHEPTAINSRIRKILNSFSRSAYVGYTATPFANIFIHERGATAEEGPDLFPSSFIINLAAPSNYVGPERIFGRPSITGRTPGLPLVRIVADHASDDGATGWMPPRHRNGHVPLRGGSSVMPDSLVEAIDSFVLACAARRVRGQATEHSSMLVHVTRFTSVQGCVREQVETQVRMMRQRIVRQIDHEHLLQRLRGLWHDDHVATMDAVASAEAGNEATGVRPTWDEVLAALPDTIEEIRVRVINGTAKDALDYADNVGSGLKVIAIGGDKLARGLTLEGLCVSYFLRASRMYDTLMQMGRWFGYRAGYLDLCRLYTTSDLTQWFAHITDAAAELREEFELMAHSGATPREYGLRVQSHPVLMVTSRLKMRSAKDLMLSFSGQLLETVALYSDRDVLARNITAARSLAARLGEPLCDPVQTRGGRESAWKGALWQDVAPADVIDFLNAYKTHPDAHKVNAPLLAEFIASMASVGELTRWSVAVIGGGEGNTFAMRDDVTVDMLKRTNASSEQGKYAIGRLLSPRDETIDIDEPTWNAALALTRSAWHADPARTQGRSPPEAPSGPAVRRVLGSGAPGVRPRTDRGLLLLYVLDPNSDWTSLPADSPPVVAFGISFPGSDSGRKVAYRVNNVLWEQEYGPAE